MELSFLGYINTDTVLMKTTIHLLGVSTKWKSSVQLGNGLVNSVDNNKLKVFV